MSGERFDEIVRALVSTGKRFGRTLLGETNGDSRNRTQKIARIEVVSIEEKLNMNININISSRLFRILTSTCL